MADDSHRRATRFWKPNPPKLDPGWEASAGAEEVHSGFGGGIAIGDEAQIAIHEVVGRSFPLGATVKGNGANFSVFSRNGTSVELLFFDREDDAGPARVIRLDPSINHTYHYWHVFVPGVRPGQIYAYRVEGLFDPAKGMRFDPDKVFLDPYGRGVVVPKNYSRKVARCKGDNAAAAMKSVVLDTHVYDWEGDMPLRRASSLTVVFEMHVRGLHDT